MLTSDEYQNSDYTSNQISADIPKVSTLHQSKRGAIVHRQVLIWQTIFLSSHDLHAVGTVYINAGQMTWSSGRAVFTMAGATL